ncbi:MAG: tetraacyldisaccharide 4'-kinase [Holosporaceae bacterium]|jgi:tetraacyldisaccharide 4'-kinase|nr:tetraacyldisaccharide 4'-kinase [Holosporaceae bacterium]
MIFFKAPKFWYHKPSLLQKILLRPIANIYSYISTRNYWGSYGHELKGAKVIAVGGITIGGSGKTMVVKAFCEILKSRNKKAAILSRGYGRINTETLRVNTEIHSYRDVGDEPLLLAKTAPVFVGRDRFKSAKLAENEGFDAFILDDGITQKFLKPDVKLVVVDDNQRFGNEEMFPLGPNRLNFEKIKADIDGVVVIGKQNRKDAFNYGDIPVFCGKILQDFSKIRKKIIIFCGIGYPDKFFNSFGNFEVIEKIAFPDHNPYSNEDLERLISAAEIHDAQLITTEKDFTRVPIRYRGFVTPVSARVAWTESEKTIQEIERALL